MAKLLCLPLIIFIFLVFPKLIYADTQIVINEFLPDPSTDENTDEWVELYNLGDETKDVDGWSLCDKGNKVLNISSDNTDNNTKIAAKGWLTINRNGASFSLNNSGDEIVSLYALSDCSGDVVDTYSYNGSKTEKSWGRIPDGTGGFEKNLDKSPGSTNIAPEPSPELKVDSDENEESSSSKTQSSKSSPKESPSIVKSSPSASKNSQNILGEKNISVTKLLPSSTPSASPESQDEAPPSTKVAGFLTGFGAFLVGASLFFYFWYYKIKNKAKDPIEEKNSDS